MNVILSGGMTGGHLYPAISFAETVLAHEPDSKFLFVGQEHSYGDTVLAKKGFEHVTVPSRGFDRKNPFKNIPIAKDMVVTSRRVARAIEEFAPDAVFSTGGHVTTAVVKAASKRGIPTFIHEQNAYPGLANKLASRYADIVFVAFKEAAAYFNRAAKTVVSGNPIRQALVSAASVDYRAGLGIAEDTFCLLVFGGSRGAAKLCDVFTQILPSLLAMGDVKIYMVSGAGYYEKVMNGLADMGLSDDSRVEILPYTERMHELYSAADLIVSRAGALSVSEIAVMGRASVLIPSPNVTHDHQTFNAKTLTDKGAAALLPDSELSAQSLLKQITSFKEDPDKRLRMAEAARAEAHTSASELIYDEVSAFIAEKKPSRKGRTKS